jgi:hypothetical protein
MEKTEPGWCLTGRSGVMGLASWCRAPRINGWLLLVSVTTATASISTTRTGVDTYAIAPRDTRAIPTSPMGAQVSSFNFILQYNE